MMSRAKVKNYNAVFQYIKGLFLSFPRQGCVLMFEIQIRISNPRIDFQFQIKEKDLASLEPSLRKGSGVFWISNPSGSIEKGFEIKMY